MRLRRDEIFSEGFVKNLPTSFSVKKVLKSVIIWWSYGQAFIGTILTDWQLPVAAFFALPCIDCVEVECSVLVRACVCSVPWREEWRSLRQTRMLAMTAVSVPVARWRTVVVALARRETALPLHPHRHKQQPQPQQVSPERRRAPAPTRSPVDKSLSVGFRTAHVTCPSAYYTHRHHRHLCFPHERGLAGSPRFSCSGRFLYGPAVALLALKNGGSILGPT